MDFVDQSRNIVSMVIRNFDKANLFLNVYCCFIRLLKDSRPLLVDGYPIATPSYQNFKSDNHACSK